MTVCLSTLGGDFPNQNRLCPYDGQVGFLCQLCRGKDVTMAFQNWVDQRGVCTCTRVVQCGGILTLCITVVFSEGRGASQRARARRSKFVNSALATAQIQSDRINAVVTEEGSGIGAAATQSWKPMWKKARLTKLWRTQHIHTTTTIILHNSA